MQKTYQEFQDIKCRYENSFTQINTDSSKTIITIQGSREWDPPRSVPMIHCPCLHRWPDFGRACHARDAKGHKVMKPRWRAHRCLYSSTAGLLPALLLFLNTTTTDNKTKH